jgi:hypothetical protein
MACPHYVHLVSLSHCQDTISTIARLQAAAGVSDTSLLNYVLSDGACLIATRCVLPETADAASLYYAEGEQGRVHACAGTL